MSVKLDFSNTDTSTVSDQALERKKRFQEARNQTTETSYRIWYTEQGDVAAFTKNPDFVPKDTWQEANIPQKLLATLAHPDINLGRYIITYSPELRTHQISIKQEQQNYTVFENSMTKCQANPDAIVTIDIQDDIMSLVYTDPEVVKTNLTFYLTKLNDPHYLLDTITFTPEVLDRRLNVSYNKQNHSIYTKSVYTFNLQ